MSLANVILLLFFFHCVFVDIKLTTIYQKVLAETNIPKWIISDFQYLGGILVLYILLSVYFKVPLDDAVWRAFYFSVLWDWIYCGVVYRNVLAPIPDWFNDWGPKTSMQRWIFDVARMAFGTFFLYWSIYK